MLHQKDRRHDSICIWNPLAEPVAGGANRDACAGLMTGARNIRRPQTQISLPRGAGSSSLVPDYLINLWGRIPNVDVQVIRHDDGGRR
jgi:hypothetical protein